MGRNFKAALLSALVLPGLGQLYKGEKLKGALLLVIVNLLLLGGLFILLQVAGKIAAAKVGGGSLSMLELVQSHKGMARGLLAAFLAVWVYGVIDAIRDRQC